MKRFSAVIVLMMAVSSLHAKTMRVTDDQDSLTPGTLRYVIENASSGDRIEIDASIQAITLTQGEIAIDKDLSIQGSRVILSGNNASRIFSVEDKNLDLEDLILTQGYNSLQGGAISSTGSLTLKRCLLAKNRADRGGAIFSEGTLTLENCTLTGNSSAFDGGAIEGRRDLMIKNSVFVGNRADERGGAIRINGTSLIENATFSGNSAGKFGGALSISVADVVLDSTTFVNNASGQNGGAIWVNGWYNNTLAVKNCTLAENSAEIHGGGLYIRTELVETHISDSAFGLNTPDNIYKDY